MKDWIFTVVSLIFLIIIFSLFLPNSTLGKYAKSIISIFILITTVKPLINFENTEIDVIKDTFNQDVMIQEDFLYFLYDVKIGVIKEDCAKILKNYEIDSAEISVEYQIDERYELLLKKINLNLSNAVINSSISHKHIIEEIKNEISKKIGIDIDLIIIYE